MNGKHDAITQVDFLIIDNLLIIVDNPEGFSRQEELRIAESNVKLLLQ